MLRTWPFGEADLLVSLLTRERGVLKGVARHAMRSRRRFGGALEPGTYVKAEYAERPREDLVRLDSFEILWSPLRAPVDWLRMAGMQLVLEVLEQALPELAPEDNVFRLAMTVLQAMEGASRSLGAGLGSSTPPFAEQRMGHPGSASVWLPVTYFCVWMCRLMGWWPELGVCAACGVDLRGERVWWSAVADGVTCEEDHRAGSQGLSAEGVGESVRVGRMPLGVLMEEEWGRERVGDLRVFAIGLLERHLERRLRSGLVLG